MTDTLERREAIARIIDPDAFRTIEERLEGFADWVKKRWAAQPEKLKEARAQAEDDYKEDVIARDAALRTADAILALSLPAREVSGERAREFVRRLQLEGERYQDGSLTNEALEEAVTRFAALATTPAPREKLEADLVEAKRALEPFAAKVADIGDDESDIDLYRPSMRYNEAPNITVGDIRRAAATLNRLSGEG